MTEKLNRRREERRWLLKLLGFSTFEKIVSSFLPELVFAKESGKKREEVRKREKLYEILREYFKYGYGTKDLVNGIKNNYTPVFNEDMEMDGYAAYYLFEQLSDYLYQTYQADQDAVKSMYSMENGTIGKLMTEIYNAEKNLKKT